MGDSTLPRIGPGRMTAAEKLHDAEVPSREDQPGTLRLCPRESA
jgi:hypothetical protein